MSAVLKIDDHEKLVVYGLREGRVKLAEKLWRVGGLICLVDKRGRFYSSSVHKRYGRHFVTREESVVEAAWHLGVIPLEWRERFIQRKATLNQERDRRRALLDFGEAAKTLGIELTPAQARQVNAVQVG